MATKINLTNTSNGLTETGYIGFSWTSLLFGGFVCFFRKDFGKGFLYIFLSIITGSLWLIVMGFFYNKWHLKKLLETGYSFNDSPELVSAARKYIGIFADNSNASLPRSHYYKNVLGIIFYISIGTGLALKNQNEIVAENSIDSEVVESAIDASPYPSIERQFIEIISKAQKESRNADNDMMRGGIKNVRDKSMCSLFTNLSVENWIGKIKSLDANSDGKGVLEIEIAEDIVIKTWNNALSDTLDNTLLDPSSELFQSLSKMKNGKKVQFSGKFFNGNEGDCIEESSLSLTGKINEPEFIFSFSEVSSSSTIRQKPVATTPEPAVTTQPVATTPEPAVTTQPVATTPEPAVTTGETSWSPSFNCAKASTGSERLICSSKEISEADVQLNQAYKTAINNSTNVNELKNSQRTWRKTIRDACSNIDCMLNAYQIRINEIKIQ